MENAMQQVINSRRLRSDGDEVCPDAGEDSPYAFGIRFGSVSLT